MSLNVENNNIEFSKMSKENLERTIHEIVMGQFLFAKTIALIYNNGPENKEMDKFIIEKTINELEFLLKK